jgi:DNA (cytosine-5)-methyltransferase 1
MMIHVSLFSGVGGLDLAAEWAGFETVLQVEKDPYCLKVLAKHWPDVRRIEDIHDVKGDEVEQSVTIISGGPPCQGHSVAGKRLGKADPRYLWPEMLRVIRAIQPAWVVFENVLGILSDGTVETVVLDMEATGYEVSPPLVFQAYACGASFEGYRVFVVSHAKAECDGFKGRRPSSGNDKHNTTPTTRRTTRTRPVNAATTSMELPGLDKMEIWDGANKPRIDGIRYGVSRGVDRNNALGNAVVPQQAYPIFRAIAEVERCE